jgi:hypothetical protein
MSWKQVGEVWSLAMTGRRREVLSVLAWHAHDDGSGARPGIALLAWKTGQAASTVKRHLNALQKSGVIEAVAYARGGRSRSTEYQLHLERAPHKSPLEHENGVTYVNSFAPQNGATQVSRFSESENPKPSHSGQETGSFPDKTGSFPPETGSPPSSKSTTNVLKRIKDVGSDARARARGLTQKEDDEETTTTTTTTTTNPTDSCTCPYCDQVVDNRDYGTQHTAGCECFGMYPIEVRFHRSIAKAKTRQRQQSQEAS